MLRVGFPWSATALEPQPDDLRMLTYNVPLRGADRSRYDVLMDWLAREEMPHLVGMQEAWTSHTSERGSRYSAQVRPLVEELGYALAQPEEQATVRQPLLYLPKIHRGGAAEPGRSAPLGV